MSVHETEKYIVFYIVSIKLYNIDSKNNLEKKQARYIKYIISDAFKMFDLKCIEIHKLNQISINNLII